LVCSTTMGIRVGARGFSLSMIVNGILPEV
jgi:hypothetical protein